MPESVYKIVEFVGTSSESWEKAASAAADRATKSLRDLRIAEVVQLDIHLDGKKRVYRSDPQPRRIPAYRFEKDLHCLFSPCGAQLPKV